MVEIQLCFSKSSFALLFSVQSKRPFYLFINKRTEKEHRIQFTGCQNFAMEIKDMERTMKHHRRPLMVLDNLPEDRRDIVRGRIKTPNRHADSPQ